MDSPARQKLINFLNETSVPVTITELCSHFKLDSSDLLPIIAELEASGLLETLQLPKEEGIKYKLTYTVKSSFHKAVELQETDYTQMNDEELDKLYKSLLLSLNKLKDKKYSLDNSEIKKKKIKKLHDYNDIKDACQTVIGKLAMLKDKTIAEIHEEYELNVHE